MSTIYTPHYRGERSPTTGLWQISQDAKIMDEPDLCSAHDMYQAHSIALYNYAKKHGSTDHYIAHRRCQPVALVYWWEIQKRAGRPNLGAI